MFWNKCPHLGHIWLLQGLMLPSTKHGTAFQKENLLSLHEVNSAYNSWCSTCKFLATIGQQTPSVNMLTARVRRVSNDHIKFPLTVSNKLDPIFNVNLDLRTRESYCSLWKKLLRKFNHFLEKKRHFFYLQFKCLMQCNRGPMKISSAQTLQIWVGQPILLLPTRLCWWITIA